MTTSLLHSQKISREREAEAMARVATIGWKDCVLVHGRCRTPLFYSRRAVFMGRYATHYYCPYCFETVYVPEPMTGRIEEVKGR